VNYCTECGFKLEGIFKYCPNCGSKINSETNSTSDYSNESSEIKRCRNCGEENPIENETCFSCGVHLNSNKKAIGVKENRVKNSTSKITAVNKSVNGSEEKTLDSKKILIISAAIIAVFVFALLATGAFDSGISESVTMVNEQTSTGGVDLANLEEINQLEEKLKANPEDMESTLHLSHLLQDAGLYDKAIVSYKKYLEKNPKNADARVDMAICYYNLNDYNNAINEMETAIKYQPSHQLAHLNLGIVNLAAQNLDASKAWFKKAVELDPNSEAGKRAQELLNSH